MRCKLNKDNFVIVYQKAIISFLSNLDKQLQQIEGRKIVSFLSSMTITKQKAIT